LDDVRHLAGPARNQEGLIAMPGFTEALKGSRELELTAIGRKTGQETSRPVWFDQEGDTLYLVPVTGTDSQWYKNVLRHPTVRLAAGGAEYTAQATPITDPARAAEVVQLFRARYGADDVAKFYPNPNVAVEVPLA
jgi:deazaflavin-dependent oxidoreductase (nitroreductase family)